MGVVPGGQSAGKSATTWITGALPSMDQEGAPGPSAVAGQLNTPAPEGAVAVTGTCTQDPSPIN
jgi:hypothetical protein